MLFAGARAGAAYLMPVELVIVQASPVEGVIVTLSRVRPST
jgi:hypothetical protein